MILPATLEKILGILPNKITILLLIIHVCHFSHWEYMKKIQKCYLGKVQFHPNGIPDHIVIMPICCLFK